MGIVENSVTKSSALRIRRNFSFVKRDGNLQQRANTVGQFQNKT